MRLLIWSKRVAECPRQIIKVGGEGGVVGEASRFLAHFDGLADPRQPGKIKYPLNEVLFLVLSSLLANGDGFTDAAEFGVEKLELLRLFMPYANGTPTHGQIGNIMAALKIEHLQQCFASWMTAETGIPACVIAIDGQESRRSFKKKTPRDAIHMVTAFAARQRLVLAQQKVDEKSNEIVAIPKLLDLFGKNLKGSVVTIDAMGCQRAIAEKIVEHEADYILALKGNQSTLHDDVKLFVAEQQANELRGARVTQHETVEKGHGRIERRRVTVIHDIGWIQQRHNWPGLKSVVVVESTREILDSAAVTMAEITSDKKIGKTAKKVVEKARTVEKETRFYLTSLSLVAFMIGVMIRSHWSIENSLHWVLDVVFGQDNSRIRMGNAPGNCAIMRHGACNILRSSQPRRASSRPMSIRLRRKVAAWSDNYLEQLMM